MKITDYGLWFKRIGLEIYTKTLTKKLARLNPNLYLNGTCIGRISYGLKQKKIFFEVYPKTIEKLGFRINPNSPGETVEVAPFYYRWNFPPNYIPSESDFQELP